MPAIGAPHLPRRRAQFERPVLASVFRNTLQLAIRPTTSASFLWWPPLFALVYCRSHCLHVKNPLHNRSIASPLDCCLHACCPQQHTSARALLPLSNARAQRCRHNAACRSSARAPSIRRRRPYSLLLYVERLFKSSPCRSLVKLHSDVPWCSSPCHVVVVLPSRTDVIRRGPLPTKVLPSTICCYYAPYIIR
jgi:hypothetical protein